MKKKNSLSDSVTTRDEQKSMTDEKGKPTYLYYEWQVKKKVKELTDRFDCDCDNHPDKSGFLQELSKEVFGEKLIA